MIRVATRSDIPSIVEIENLSFDAPWSSSVFRSYADYPGFIVLESEGVILGYAVLVVIKRAAHLASIATHPKYRRMGVATALLEGCILLAKENSYSLIRLEVREKNNDAQKFYLSNGFEMKGVIPNYYPDDNAIIMELDLEC
ncbi:ribosomal protein S18-alanine N-acetyltransferase [Methanococcoides orientis]|uniref:ribosomal protein S18-alanine N-acetyltransferase n=1 Tax=Methanococcoides orientis TaxID=2822137 RepID=UPI001E460DE5|nr:ribosomal protein S18-alanine N-acetyltransferase [Methanococcoides orientis]UGV40567.1 ribosomal protein S18-alanine N-acetyltransferase [Methanococcoides orientis]